MTNWIHVICILGPLQTFSAQHITFLVDNEALTPGSMFGYVITRHTVMTRDQPPLRSTVHEPPPFHL